jgi:hypothetical protein
VGVGESRCDAVSGVNLIGGELEAFADEQYGVSFVDQLALRQSAW